MLEKVCNSILVVLLVLALVVLLVMGIPLLQGKENFNIVTDHMLPGYPVGSMVVVKPAAAETIAVNDVIAFTGASQSNIQAIHRVLEVDTANSIFITKADNRGAESVYPVPFEQLRGKVDYSIPLMGNLVRVIKTPVGILTGALLLLLVVLLFILPILQKPKE